MGKIPDIKDEDSLAAWLEDQPREVSVWIASRAAARVLPLWWQYTLLNDAAQKRNVTVLPVLRCLLASTLASKRVSRGIQSFAASAVSEASAAQHIIGDLNSAHEVVSASKEAANAANKKQFIEAVLGCALSVDRATRDRLFVVPTGFRSGQGFYFIAMDAKEITDGYVPDALPLWPDGPRQLREEWTKIKAQVAASPDAADWRFWLDWYDALLAGRTMLPDPARTWDMLEKIATEIDPATWDAGPETVNPKIRKIWESYKGKALRELEILQAADDGIVLGYNVETDRFYQEDIKAENQSRLQTAVAKLNEVCLLVGQMGNLQGVLTSEMFLIDRAVKDHPENATMVFFNVKAARGLLQANIENGSCPPSEAEPVIGLLDSMLLDTQNMLLPEPSVQEGLKDRAEDSALLDSPEALKALQEAADEIAEVSEGSLADELPDNAEKAKDLYQPRAVRMTALISLVNVVVQAWVMLDYERFKATLKEFDEITTPMARVITNMTIIGGVPYGAFLLLANSPKVKAAIEALTPFF